MADRSSTARALRLRAADTPPPGTAAAVAERARGLGLSGWARQDGDEGLRIHAEGAPAALEALVSVLEELTGAAPAAERARVEGHEQFGVRGVAAGIFVVQEHAATARHFDLRLQVGEVLRSWAVPKGPSLDPAVKRLAVEVDDHAPQAAEREGGSGDGHGVIVWDRGDYEQGGRVAWPDALDRGHAVFVLHGHKLRGGFALQRTGRGSRPQWLLVKRRDGEARPGSDIVAERPESVLSGRTLDQVLRTPGR